MSHTLWDIPIDSDQEWSPVAHFINGLICQSKPCDYKLYYMGLFNGFRYLRFRYIMSSKLPYEKRNKLRGVAWFNLVVRLETRETRQWNPRDIPNHPLPAFDPKNCKDYAKDIVKVLVEGAKALLSNEINEKLEGFQAELERDFALMLRGKAPGSLAGQEEDGSDETELEMEGMSFTKDDIEDVEKMMGVEESEDQHRFARRNAVSV